MFDIRKIVYIVSCYCIAIALIYNCNSIWLTIPNLNKLEKIINLLLILSILYLLVVNKYNKTSFKDSLFVSLLVGIYLFVYTIFTDISYSLVIDIVILILFIFLLKNNSYICADVLLKYSSLITIIALISIIFWIFGSNLGFLKPSGYVLSNWFSASNYLSGGIDNTIPSYHGLYFEAQAFSSNSDVLSFLINVKRNTAIFTEAPMSSLNFSLALLINEYSSNKSVFFKLRRIILIIAILTTLSTTGYIFLLILLIGKFYVINWRYANLSRKLLILFATVLAMLLVIFLLNQKISFNVDSSDVRIDDYKIGYKVWQCYPIFGVGLNHQNIIMQFMDNWRISNSGLSNSISDLFSEGGLYIAFLYVFSFGRGIYLSIKNRNYKKLLFIILTLYLFAFTIFTFRYILFLILIWFCIEDRNDIRIRASVEKFS